MKQVWKKIQDYPNYEVSNFGSVRSVEREIIQFGHKRDYKRIMPSKVLKQRKQNSGYMLVWLSINGKSKPYTVHRLVAKAFVGGYFEGADVNHKDGNRQNNNVDNLEWVTRSDNIKHSYRVLKSRGNGKRS